MLHPVVVDFSPKLIAIEDRCHCRVLLAVGNRLRCLFHCLITGLSRWVWWRWTLRRLRIVVALSRLQVIRCDSIRIVLPTCVHNLFTGGARTCNACGKPTIDHRQRCEAATHIFGGGILLLQQLSEPAIPVRKIQLVAASLNWTSRVKRSLSRFGGTINVSGLSMTRHHGLYVLALKRIRCSNQILVHNIRPLNLNKLFICLPGLCFHKAHASFGLSHVCVNWATGRVT